ncbi:MAG: YHYH protein [Solirubrobacterales bacterium]
MNRVFAIAALGAGSLGICVALFGTGKMMVRSSAQAMAASSGPDLTALPLGDGKTTTSTPQRGYLYECRALSGGGGAASDGSWIHGSTYDLMGKVTVDGSVDWPNAKFAEKVKGKSLLLRGDGLPKHVTGTFPVQPSDDAYQIDRNPNRISAYSVSDKFATRPKYRKTPGCVGGQVGVMTSGVALFSAVDGENRDAVAHEVQDSCSGHPERTGVYHYHGLPACIGTGSPTKQSKLIGWALDGFPIYGPRGKGGRYLSNADLDECHGTTSKVTYLGKKRRLYHYVANYEYPYTVGCYRGRR